MAGNFKNRVVGLSAAAALAIGFAASAAAQTAEQTPESPWVKVCGNDPAANKQICDVRQSLRTDTGQFLADVALREIDGEARKTLLLAVPTGMLIQPGLRVQVDSGKQIEAKYSICIPNACYSNVVVDDAFIESMKKGSTLILTSLNQQAKQVPFRLTLIGFTKVYEGDPIDATALEERQRELQSELQKRADEARQKLIDKQNEATGAN